MFNEYKAVVGVYAREVSTSKFDLGRIQETASLPLPAKAAGAGAALAT
jgi:hypothetical protein